MGGDELPECDALRSYVVSANDLWDIDEGDDARLELLDEIDEVLETNAEEFVKSYVQKGGQ